MLIALKPLLLAGSVAVLAALATEGGASAESKPWPTQNQPIQLQAQTQPQPQLQPQTQQAQTQQGEAPTQTAPEPSLRDRQLIDSVEKAYHSGLTDYQQGHVAAARANFDYAVDLLLKCNCDLRGDQALSEEFDRIVDAVNTLEMDALRQGNGPAPQAEPSPVDVAGNITTPANPNVAAKAEAELKVTQSDLPLVMNEYVASYIEFFQNSPRGRERSSRRSVHGAV